MADQLQPNLNPFALAKELSGYLLIDGTLQRAKSGKVFAVVSTLMWLAIIVCGRFIAYTWSMYQ